VVDCFLALLKMGIASKLVQSNNAKIKNNEAFVCSLACVKILLKSKTQNNYLDALSNLYVIIKENYIHNSIVFQKHNGFTSVKKWIETLMASNAENDHSVEYLSKVLELCGLVAHSIGDLDQMPLASEIIVLLIETTKQQGDAIYKQKRELLINFIVSQIDDKNLRLDLQRVGVSFVFEEIKNLA